MGNFEQLISIFRANLFYINLNFLKVFMMQIKDKCTGDIGKKTIPQISKLFKITGMICVSVRQRA